jgi:hypothetical protein
MLGAPIAASIEATSVSVWGMKGMVLWRVVS